MLVQPVDINHHHYYYHRCGSYLQTDKVSMLIMMPDDVNGSELMIERLSKENFLDILDSLGYQDTEVLLPQLAAFTNGLDLEPFFKKLGVKAAFNQTVSGSADHNNKTSSTSRDHASKSPTVTLVSMKQNAYFSMSFITINSVGSVGTKLGRYTKYFNIMLYACCINYNNNVR